jgi:hypothetical protein
MAWQPSLGGSHRPGWKSPPPPPVQRPVAWQGTRSGPPPTSHHLPPIFPFTAASANGTAIPDTAPGPPFPPPPSAGNTRLTLTLTVRAAGAAAECACVPPAAEEGDRPGRGAQSIAAARRAGRAALPSRPKLPPGPRQRRAALLCCGRAGRGVHGCLVGAGHWWGSWGEWGGGLESRRGEAGLGVTAPGGQRPDGPAAWLSSMTPTNGHEMVAQQPVRRLAARGRCSP